MFSKKFLTVILLTLALFSSASAHDDTYCNDHCMQCVGRYGRNYCQMCHGVRNEWGRCTKKEDKDSHCATRDPNGVCLRCEEGKTLSARGVYRECIKEAKSHQKCLSEVVFPDGWTKCQLCKGSSPNSFDGKCVNWKKDKDGKLEDGYKRFKNCHEATYGNNGYTQCYRCNAGYILHYNGLRPFDGTWCVKEDDASLDEEHKKNHQGCLTYNIGNRYCDVCNVDAGYHKSTAYRRGCAKKGKNTVE